MNFADMEYVSVKDWAEVHGVSERTARNYCAQGKIAGACLVGKTWSIPADAEAPKRKKTSVISPLLASLREQKGGKTKGGIYHRIQIDLTYNSNHMEGSGLPHDQTRYIFETNTIGISDRAVNVDEHPSLEDVIDFHQRFEVIHPFQDGNGRVGRLIMFRECLRLGLVPFIITDELKIFYYNGLRNWPEIKGYLIDTCLTAQNNFKIILNKFRIKYKD